MEEMDGCDGVGIPQIHWKVYLRVIGITVKGDIVLV